MPGCHVTDVIVRLWNALDAGDLKEAKRVYGLLAPLFALEMVKGSRYAEVLRRRGVINSARSRLAASSKMDEYDHRALDDILRDLEPLFTWHDGGPILYSDSEVEYDKGAHGEPTTPSSSDDDVAPFDQVG